MCRELIISSMSGLAAAFGVAICEGKGAEAALRFASAAASICIEHKGAIPSLPSLSDVQRRLQNGVEK